MDRILAGKQPWDEQFYNDDLVKKNTEERKGYEKEMREAEEKAGETEVTEWIGKIAEFWARVCDKDQSLASFDSALYKKTPTLALILYAVLAGTLSLKRVDFKHRVINSAEVLAVLEYRRNDNFTPSAQPNPTLTIITKTVVLPGGIVQQLAIDPGDLWGGFTSLETGE
ncbi:hypothetical protein L211DRAFT_879947 [Terfezia boudieri ATCC MYA-4762]|uniref:Uncharacterized protein n=1 Tax=Terfezia boudieri ATCC MYA-4762 TaxID=1051890 RepID=A0A3N4LL94_9PEZI|nr:hypothetical protein L211DRAFT_879947 [Terfezia boudieri ATCC MYA-4762]